MTPSPASPSPRRTNWRASCTLAVVGAILVTPIVAAIPWHWFFCRRGHYEVRQSPAVFVAVNSGLDGPPMPLVMYVPPHDEWVWVCDEGKAGKKTSKGGKP